MCKASWWKSGPNNYIWLTSCGWGLHDGPLTHNHIHTYRTIFCWIKSKDTRTINPSLQKWLMENVYKLPNHTKYVQGDFCHQIFHILLMGQILLYVPFHRSLHPFIHLAKTQRHKHGGCMQFQLPSCFGLHAKSHLSTPSQHLRKVTLLGFWWIGPMEFAPWLELLKK